MTDFDDAHKKAVESAMQGDLAFVVSELRMFAGNAYGNPPSVKITAKTLIEWAELIEESRRP